MLKLWKRFSDWTDRYIQTRAIKTELAGKGPWIIYRCQKCWSCFIETDIIGSGTEGISVRDGNKKMGECPRCGNHKWEMAVLSFFENLKFVFIILTQKMPKGKK